MITKFSDIEAYFAQAEHLAAALQLPAADMSTLVDDVVQNNNNLFVLKFRDKREEIKRSLYRGDEEECPDVAALIPGNLISVENSLGKLLLARINERIQQLGKNPGQILIASDALHDEAIANLL
jgi:hypothetical protein